MKILETILEEVELINISEIFFSFGIMSLNNDAINAIIIPKIKF